MNKQPDINTAELRSRYPDVFDRPLKSRAAVPTVLVALLRC